MKNFEIGEDFREMFEGIEDDPVYKTEKLKIDFFEKVFSKSQELLIDCIKKYDDKKNKSISKIKKLNIELSSGNLELTLDIMLEMADLLGFEIEISYKDKEK